MTDTEEKATAAATGASATERFRTDKSGATDTPPERVSLLARELLGAVHGIIRKHEVTYPEYDALKAWLIQVGADGEWPLFLDVFVEHAVEAVNSSAREGSIRTIAPAPYQIPTDGATGALIRAANWHAWRPAHLHMKVSAPGYQLITTQLYFPGDPHNDDDIATAVKPELMLDPKPAADGHGIDVEYDYVLDPA